MNKIKSTVLTLLNFPLRLFSKVSPLTLIKGSKLSKKCSILSGTRFYNSSIDDYSYIGRGCFIEHTKIGKFCSIADKCNIGLASHPISWVSTSPVFCSGKNVLKANFADAPYKTIKNTIIENDVWIGMNACIMAGVNIGTGAIIGAGAIVTKDVEPYAIVGGNPAKLIRFRFDESQVQYLLKTKWWDWGEDKLRSESKLFDNIEMFLMCKNGNVK